MPQPFPNWPVNSPQFIDNPYQFYKRRRKINPIGNTQTGAWCLTGYDVVKEALQNSDIGAMPARGNTGNIADSLRQLGARWVVFSDPPVHTRIRRLLGRSLHRLVKEDAEKIIGEILEKLLSETENKKEIDLVNEFAYPMPLYVILRLIGVPHEDWPRVVEWVKRLSILIDPYVICPYPIADVGAAATSLYDYLAGLATARRNDPQQDLISSLTEADEGGDILSTEDLISNISFLLFAGHETTVNLIGNGMFAVLNERDRWQELTNDPGKIPSAVEEFLRYDSPVQMTVKQALKDVELGGYAIAKGDELRLFIGAANRDPSQFENPDLLIIDRSPNPHLAFGKGDHTCLGGTLARLEAKMAFKILCEHFPNMKLSLSNPPRKVGLNLRGFQRIPVDLGN